jgi:6-phosphofructokinase 2
MSNSSLIVTFTPNPSVDLGCEADAVHPIRKIRTTNERFDAGGGGVNVSRVVRELGGETLAVLMVGGVTGRFIEELIDASGVPRRSVEIAGRSRISQVVQDLSSGQEYRFVPEGPEIAEGECQAAMTALAAAEGGWLVLSGSLARGMPEDFFAQSAAAAVARGQRVVVDSSGAALRVALAAGGLELVKPSFGEFEALVGRKLAAAEELEAAALDLARSGAARLVAVTLGHRGALLASAERVWRLPAPDVPVKGASGAGDSFVAAMTLALARGEAPEQAFAWGSASGGATVAQPGTAHAKKADVELLYRQMRDQLT